MHETINETPSMKIEHSETPENVAESARRVVQAQDHWNTIGGIETSMRARLDSIIETCDHAQATIAQSPSPANAAANVLGKIRGLAKQIAEKDLRALILEAGGVVTTCGNLAMKQTQQQIEINQQAAAIRALTAESTHTRGAVEELMKLATSLGARVDYIEGPGSRPMPTDEDATAIDPPIVHPDSSENVTEAVQSD